MHKAISWSKRQKALALGAIVGAGAAAAGARVVRGRAAGDPAGGGFRALLLSSHRTRHESRYHFHRGYRERVALADGSSVWIRPVQPRDKRLLAAGLRRLSPRSAYLRFHAPRSAFTERELRYLTEMDGVDHFALGAVRGWGKAREGLGVARFVRLQSRREEAEVALVVADEMQHRGLGRLLLLRLAQAAQERGITILSAEILATNRPVLRLLERTFRSVRKTPEGATVHVEIPIGAPGAC